LEVRDAGRWQQCRFRLDGTILEHYDLKDAAYSQVRETTGVRDMLFLSLDSSKREISFQSGGRDVRLRAVTESDAQAWHGAFQEVLSKHVQPQQPQTQTQQADLTGTRGGIKGGSTTGDAPTWPKGMKTKKSVTLNSERMDSKGSVGSKVGKMSTRSTVMLNEGEEDEMDPADLLERISNLLKEKQLRVADIFRHPTYNPSYLKTKDEQLDADEIVCVLARAGLMIPRKTCKALIKLLDDSGDMMIDMTELEAAIRAHRRGKEIWDVRAEMPKLAKAKSHLDFQRRAMSEVQLSKKCVCGNVFMDDALFCRKCGAKREAESTEGPHDADQTMRAIQKLMDEKRVRITDLFRHPHYNPSYLEKGDESMAPDEMQTILSKAGCELPLKDVRHMIDCLDYDGSGTLEIPEFEAAMRKFRRGELKWIEPKPRAEKRHVNMDYINQLHTLHSERQAKRADMAKRLEAREQEEIEMEKDELRIGSRKDLEEGDFDPISCTKRLYEERKDLELKRIALEHKHEAMEKQKLDSARLRPVRSASDPALLERNKGFQNIGERLHAMKAVKESQMSAVRQQVEARMLTECDRISYDVFARGGVIGDRHEQLFAEANDRRQRREKQHWKNLEAEQAYHAELYAHPVRQALVDLSRIEELHKEHEIRRKKKENSINDKVVNDRKAIEEAAKRAKLTSTKGVTGKALQQVPFQRLPEHAAIREQVMNRIEAPKGFGSREPRKELLGNIEPQWCMESVDHALNAVNQTCAARCNCTPEESQLRVIHDLVEPLKAAMTEYRSAYEESQLLGDGASYLKTIPSMRLFANGSLMEEPAGWHNCCEPDPLRQTEDDFDVLMELAEKAQAVLLSEVGPEAGDKFCAEKLGRQWPKGAKWNHPRATKKAQFAYNPGVKPRDVALAKAFVRYGPSERENRFRHLLDLARCTLVFSDATMMRAGLEQIIDRFEVIDVRNWYNPSYQNLLGEKYIEVLVVVQCPEPFICEIRLEEMHFFVAHEKVRPHLEQISKAMAELYHGNGADPLAISYLARWVLHRPKEPHSVTVYKKHLSRRFGSTVVAWRKSMGGGNQANFLKFRQACQDIGERHRCCEYWQAFDATRSGNISLFELDPDACVLLIKIYWRICGLASAEQLDDPEKLFSRLTCKSVVHLARPGRLEAHEWRRVMKVLGFDASEADRAFKYLDLHGGEAHQPPATILPTDIAWLRRLPQLISIECVMMKDSSSSSEMDSLRSLTYAGRTQAITDPRRMRIPAMCSQRLSTRGSLTARGSISARASSRGSLTARPSITGASRPSIVVRRSSSAGIIGLPDSQRSQRNSISSKNSGGLVPGMPLTSRRASETDLQAPGMPLTARRANDTDFQKPPMSPGSPGPFSPPQATPSTAPPTSPSPEELQQASRRSAGMGSMFGSEAGSIRGSGARLSVPFSERSTQLASPAPESEEAMSDTGADSGGEEAHEEEVEGLAEEGLAEGAADDGHVEGIGFGESESEMEEGSDVSDTF